MSHYRNFTPPFEIPDSWEWVRLDEIATSNIGLTYSPQDIVEDGVPVYRSNNIKDNKICLDEIVYVSCHILEKQYLHNGDLLICARNGSRRLVGKNIIIENLERPTSFGAFMAVCRSCYNPWIKLLLDSAYFNSYLDESNSTAINQITQKMLLDFVLPFPPQKEQSRINAAFQSIECIIDIIEQRESELKTGITNLKYRILDLAMQGKLVPQDPTDEPAADMLRRINPKAKIITDNPHYPQLPDNWVHVPLEDITEYDQPQPYIVQNTAYSDIYAIPVLTAGKSFILGYTNEDFGVYENVPSIIFDDFTTDSRLVKFPFKVKSSAIKIIQVKRGLNIEYVAMFMSITRLIGETHKRYWLSEYSKILIPIPPLEEQNRIIERINTLYRELDKVISNLTD